MAIEGFSPSPPPPPPPPYYQLLERGSARLGRVKKERVKMYLIDWEDGKFGLLWGIFSQIY